MSFEDGNGVVYGQQLNTVATNGFMESFHRFRLIDKQERAKRKALQLQLPKVSRPIVTVCQINNFLAGGGNYKKALPVVGNVNLAYHFKNTTKIPYNADIELVVKNAIKYRMISVDTERKDEPIFLIIGDFEGNVLLINNARLIPDELRAVLADVSIFKLQSNVVEDAKILETVGVRLCGLVDSQVIFGAFVKPKSYLGTVRQARECHFEERPYDYKHMNFNCVRSRQGDVVEPTQTPNKVSLLHAVSDALQPLITLFTAGVRRVNRMRVGLKPDENIFDILVEILVKTAGAHPRCVEEFGAAYYRTMSENWAVSFNEEDTSYNDINHRSEVMPIVDSISDWLPNRNRKSNVVRKNNRDPSKYTLVQRLNTKKYKLRHPEKVAEKEKRRRERKLEEKKKAKEAER